MFGRRGNDGALQARAATLGARRGQHLSVAPSPQGSPHQQAHGSWDAAPPASASDNDAAATTTIDVEAARVLLQPIIDAKLESAAAQRRPREEVAREVEEITRATLAERSLAIDPINQRQLITALMNGILDAGRLRSASSERPVTIARRASVDEAIPRIYPLIMERIDSEVAAKLGRTELQQQLTGVVAEILGEQKIQLNQVEQRDLVTILLNDMLGLGPLEPLLADESINDIMVNGPKQVFVERKGKLVLTDVTFRDNQHVMAIATRIVTQIGRRIDESTPLVDARLADGSRVNIIVPPLAIDGPSISIRKFAKRSITLDIMARQHNMSSAMATVLKIASRCRLNVLISGGTGSGKTTLLNALSQMIDPEERVVTIEDAAELQLQQPHVVRLETRPPNLEGKGEITMRDLLKNALRMRPDRIIVGEIRGAEAMDMLQAMNTGHDGSLGTIHANRPREALSRLENMIGMAGVNLPSKAVRTQIAAAVQMIIQVSRMRDGIRRITSVMEIVGMEGDIITTQDLFSYKFEGEAADGKLAGSFISAGLRPHFTPRAEYFGLDRALLDAVG
jgi:pilus assembly protein CpaF